MVTQREVFLQIRRELEENGLDYAKQRIVEYQKRLYALDLEGEVSFYAQDRDGIPVERAFTLVGGKEIYGTMLIRNSLDRMAWQHVERPANWKWSAWPPYRRNDLLGCKSVYEHCAECEELTKYDETHREDDYFNWVLRKLDFWHQNINIRLSERTGFGLYARNHIAEGTCIGEYTGMIVPWYKDDDDSKASYYMQMGCGPIMADTTQGVFTCRIDATRRGSIFRFLNHSCEPNAVVKEMRCGLHNRINVVVIKGPIEPGKQITISYNETWFDDQNSCYCRVRTCKNKPKKKDEC